jgi:hypothetical protein
VRADGLAPREARVHVVASHVHVSGLSTFPKAPPKSTTRSRAASYATPHRWSAGGDVAGIVLVHDVPFHVHVSFAVPPRNPPNTTSSPCASSATRRESSGGGGDVGGVASFQLAPSHVHRSLIMNPP